MAFLSFRSRRRRGGFTLIEMLITLGIIAMVMGLGVPTLVRIFRRQPLPQATADLIEVASNARALAIQRGEMTELVINPAGRSVSVSGAGGSAEGHVRDRFSAQWSEGVSVEMLDVNFIEYKDAEQARVRFFPNGTCDELTVILRNDQNEYRMISWEVTTGLATMEADPNKFASR